jgi:competence protein CoiA
VITTAPSPEWRRAEGTRSASASGLQFGFSFIWGSKMEFSLVNGQRHEAQPNLSGKCQVCDQPAVAKCGEVKIWHWAHKGRRTCDPWWENETDWHRAWKGKFPEDWQEVVHRADSGEKHVADVKTDQGWVIEFQHSYLRPEERRSRDALVWVVGGARRKGDYEKFLNALNNSRRVLARPQSRRASGRRSAPSASVKCL